MRLTLRTMLAFLDDVLEGPDAKELEQKIDESKFASDLVHRIRGSVRHLRLGAPKLDGKGMGADANSVAEYLDNTMPPERVPDFEKVCLESDVQLAEVAACHQVLTIVLGEPAAVDPAIRDRMYRIGHPEAAQAPAPVSHDGNGTTAAAKPVPPPEPAITAKPAPEPLRPARAKSAARSAGRSTGQSTGQSTPAQQVPREYAIPLRSLAITLVLFFVVTGVALRAIGPFNKHHPLVVMFTGVSDSKQVAQPSVPSTNGEPEPILNRSAAESVDSTAGKPIAESPTTSPGTNLPATEVSGGSSGAAGAETAKTNASAEAETKSLPVPPPVTPVESPTTPTTPTETESVKGVAGPTSVPAVPAKPMTDLTPTLKPPEVADTPVNVGRYISEGQVLARLDAEKNAWMVLPPDTPLSAEERLLSLPTYRPQVLVAPSVKLTVSGEAFLKLHVPDAINLPRFTVDFGRILVVPVGEMETSVQIDFGGRGGQLSFGDVESVVAIDVRPYLPPGADPLVATPNLVVQLWATTGSAEWREVERAPVRLNAGQRLQLIDEAPAAIIDGEPLPDWIDGKNVRDIDRRASQELYRFLTTDRPLALSLLELTNYRQVEVRALSCRALCYLNIFEPGIAALGDERFRIYWDAQIAAIHSTLSFGPETIAKLRADIEKLYGKDTEKIFRILRGYSPEQLTSGGAAELVEALENELTTTRVLALFTLMRITDKTFNFYPEKRPEQEKSKILRWRKSLEDGQIVYKNPPVTYTLSTPAPPIEGPK